jgi:hypothetical protein
MRILALLAACLLACGLSSGSALAQHQGKRGDGFKAPGQFVPEDRRRTGDAARGEDDRRDPRRQERMRPEEREKLRRDIEDANRGMERRR